MIAPRPCLEAALAYAARGWAVLPVWWPNSTRATRCSCRASTCEKPGKHPIGILVPHGVKEATKDPETIRGWWRRFPDANVGIATGSASGFEVLDVDGEIGEASITTFEHEHGPLPMTPESLTGGGGRHVLLVCRAGLRNSVRFAPGLDVRTNRGYIVAPPSIHASGRTYEWEATHHPDETPLAPWPEWLAAVILAATAPVTASTRFRSSAIPAGVATTYGRAALIRACEALAKSRPGFRNSTLNATAYNLGRLVAAGHLSAEDVAQRLRDGAARNGYAAEAGEVAVDAVIACGLAAGNDAGPRGPTLPWARRETVR